MSQDTLSPDEKNPEMTSPQKPNRDQHAQAQQNHPLHGVGLEAMLGELVRHYGWGVLAEQIPIKCFNNYPTFVSCKKFLKKTVWARERLEAFYLYRFKNLPMPSDEQHALAPRERLIDISQITEPASIELGDPEFFDDPASGPVFPSRKSVEATRSNEIRAKETSPSKAISEPISTKTTNPKIAKRDIDTGDTAASKNSTDPWAKWK